MAARGVGEGSLVAAALSALTESVIVSQKDFCDSFGEVSLENKLDILVGHSNSIELSGRYLPRRFTVSECENLSPLLIRDNLDKLHSVVADLSSETVEELKRKICTETGVSPYEQLLKFGEKILTDKSKLVEYGLTREATILMERLKKVQSPPKVKKPWYLAQSDLAPSFDCDFSRMADDGLEYRRGGRKYKRPYGWTRFALNVLGKYENDKWLGPSGMRTQEAPGEWAVSFHGVMEHEVLNRGKRVAATKKIQSIPDIESDKFKEYEKKFEFQGSTYKAVLQSRINQAKMQEKDGVFVCSKEDIRPYGICVKKIA